MKKIAMSFFILSSSTGWALQPLNETDMANAVGQDGITIDLSFSNASIVYDQIILTDRNGMGNSDTYNKTASMVIAPSTRSPSQGVQFLQNDNVTAANQPIRIKVDTDGGSTSGAFMNLNVGLPTDAKRIHLSPFSVYLAPTTPVTNLQAPSTTIFEQRRSVASTDNVLKPGAREMLYVGDRGIDIDFKEGDTLAVNIQLGNQPQEHFLRISSGSLMCIASGSMCNGTDYSDTDNPIQIYSYAENGGVTQKSSSIKFGLKLMATDEDKGFRLYGHDDGPFSGFYVDIVGDNVSTSLREDGLVLGADGTTDKFDLTLTNITMGDKTAVPNTNTFNGLNNGSMGNIGLTGVQVTDFKATIRGM